MIDSIISGKVYGKPEQRTSGKGTEFVRLKVRIPTQDNSAMFASAVCFSKGTAQQLLALDDGDSVSIAGSITIKPWLNNRGEACSSVSVVIEQVLTPYHISRKRSAMLANDQAKKFKATADTSIEDYSATGLEEDLL